MAEKKYLTLEEASEWASIAFNREITKSNISYLIQYGKIHRYNELGNPKATSKGVTLVSREELLSYFKERTSDSKEMKWKKYLGDDINWRLSFDRIKESERTKHVHRLHQYKGKFIPQLVEYFLNGHTDDFKTKKFVREGDVVLDPFAGSGTTLVQCLELGLHSIGIDISEFNCMITAVKTQEYDIGKLDTELRKAASATERLSRRAFRHKPENDIRKLLNCLNETYYPTPEYKILLNRIRKYQWRIMNSTTTPPIDSKKDRQTILSHILNNNGDSKTNLENDVKAFLGRNSIPFEFEISSSNIDNLANSFSQGYSRLALKELDRHKRSLTPEKQMTLDSRASSFAHSAFLSVWFTERQKTELRHYLDQIESQTDKKIQQVMRIILSRTARSCRATKHVDLATLVKPQIEPYYCRKHFKICKPVSTIIRHLSRYTEDTIRRLKEFSRLRKNVFSEVINGDAKTIDLSDCIKKRNHAFYELLEDRGIDVIFTSPPYVGQIDYHEQHAYAYELFNIERKDSLEIGRKSDGTGRKAQKEYVKGISDVLTNIRQYLNMKSHILIVANDRWDLYPRIAERSGFEIVETYKRPVLNRTEKDKQPYAESIFHLRP